MNVPVYSLHPSALILRGVVSIAFGLLAFAWPGPGLFTIVLLYGAYALIDGVTALATAVRLSRAHRPWGVPVVEGMLGVAVGGFTLFWPDITLLALSVLVGAWALATGILEVSAALSLRRIAPDLEVSRAGKALLGVAGAISILLGASIFAVPTLGALALVALLATYAVVFGGIVLALGIRLKRSQRALPDSRREIREAA